VCFQTHTVILGAFRCDAPAMQGGGVEHTEVLYMLA